MDSMLWLAIAAVSAVTAVILARRKNRSAVIWPVAAFLFPPALLPLFALAPLAEKNTARLDRQFLGAMASILILLVGTALIRYGSLHPCDMYAYEDAEELVALGGQLKTTSEERVEIYRSLYTPGECWVGVLENFF
jgi:hypothetical protein